MTQKASYESYLQRNSQMSGAIITESARDKHKWIGSR